MTRPGPVPAPGAAGMEEVFGQERARLVGLAYRITGSRSDAEDLVQEAWLRAQRVDWASVDRPAAWLTTVVSRLALDELRSARRRRETYVGPWLPDPVLTAAAEPAAAAGTGAGARGRPTVSEAEDVDPAAIVELAESLTYGFLRMLEALDPVERVVFLLADVFDTPFDEIAAAVGRSPAACRQVASRARRRVREGRVRRDLPADARRVAYEMLAMVAAGDVEAVMALLADDAVLLSDGGASVRAARRPVVGPARIARFLVNLDRRYPYRVVRTVTVNGEPGMVMHVGERTQLVVAVEVVAGRVHAIHAISNPEKLAALGIATPLA